MPSKITMAGGAPWGFRLSGGGAQPLTVSRLTPGGKASLDGILVGDQVAQINGQSVSGLQLGELMELIRNTGEILNLTVVSKSESQAIKQGLIDDMSIRMNLREEHIESLNVSCYQDSQHFGSNNIKNAYSPIPEEVVVEVPPSKPKPAEKVQTQNQPNTGIEENEKSFMTKEEWYALPQYIRRQVRPPKETPSFKPQVHWLHGKLRLNANHEKDAMVNAAGQELRNAVMAQQGPIEIQAGPINGKITHGQYNTPLNMYSDPNIIDSLVSQAVASGADIQNPNFFQNTGVKVDTQSSTFKQIHGGNRGGESSRQSRSFNILNTLMKHPYEVGH